MIIIIGLGNPGRAYNQNRHNIGFQTLDAYAEKNGLHFTEKAIFDAMVTNDEPLILVKPTTWMNNSGISVRSISKQFNDALITVVYDDIDIPIGQIKCSFDRGAGGHNGVQSVIDHLGTKEFFRVRIGVRPVHEELLPRIAPPNGFEKFLLSDFAPFENELHYQGISKAVDIIEDLKKISFVEVMNKYN